MKERELVKEKSERRRGAKADKEEGDRENGASEEGEETGWGKGGDPQEAGTESPPDGARLKALPARLAGRNCWRLATDDLL